MRGRDYSGAEEMDPAVRDVPAGRNSPGSVRARYAGIRKLKKLGKAEGRKRETEGPEAVITLDDIILAGLERGLTITEMRRMQLGQVVDFCIAYNERQEEAEKKHKIAEKKGTRRKANQGDINALFG